MQISRDELKARLSDSSGGDDQLAGTRLGIPEQIKPTLRNWAESLFGVKPNLDELSGCLCAGLVGGGLQKMDQEDILRGAEEIIKYWEKYDELYGDDSNSHKPHFEVGFVKALVEVAEKKSADEPEEDKNPGEEARGFSRRGFRRKG